MVDTPRVVLTNLYINQLPACAHAIATVQVRYVNPSLVLTNLVSEPIRVEAIGQSQYQSALDSQVQQQVLTLAKYRQTQIAETKLQSGDRQGAVTLLQSAAKTALQMGDQNAATVLQENATRLQSGEELSEGDNTPSDLIPGAFLCNRQGFGRGRGINLIEPRL